MNTSTENTKKDRILKTLAVGGFIGLIIIIAWLGVQLIGVLPNAFSSLASIADTVYNYEEVTIEVESNKETAAAGESFGLTWNVPRTDGFFTFTYDCAEGIAASVRVIGGTIEPVACDTEKNLGSVSGIEVVVSSEKDRSVDMTYSIAFIPTGTNEAIAVTDSTITIINPDIKDNLAVATTTPEIEAPVITPPPTEPTPPVTPVTPKPKPTTPKPVIVPTYTYGIPVSNPNGFTDLAAKLVNIGTLRNGTFMTSRVIDNDEGGTLLFEIKNIGTKTSRSFTYTVILPNGTVYTSPTQDSLKPNERVTAAVGFDVTNITGNKTFSVTATSRGETQTNNNGFTGTVTIIN